MYRCSMYIIRHFNLFVKPKILRENDNYKKPFSDCFSPHSYCLQDIVNNYLTFFFTFQKDVKRNTVQIAHFNYADYIGIGFFILPIRYGLTADREYFGGLLLCKSGLLAAVILLLCLIRVWNAVRREQKHSIVENIREL